MAEQQRMLLTAALRWAWIDELPKEPAGATPPKGLQSAWEAISRFGQHYAIIDRQPNRYGCVPFDEADLPHPDAVRIAEAVNCLGDKLIAVPKDWHPMHELEGCDQELLDEAVGKTLARMSIIDDDGVRRFKTNPTTLLIRYTILGLEPDWELYDVPTKRLLKRENGQAKWFVKSSMPQLVGTNPDGSNKIAHVDIERNGWSPRSRRPLPGAYQKTVLDPDPVPVMIERAEYEVLFSALCKLYVELSGKLETIQLEPVTWPRCPWEGDSPERQSGCVLPDLRQKTFA